MSRIARTALVALMGFYPCIDSTAARDAAVPQVDLDMKNIIRAATRIHHQSLPNCYAANCVRIDCALSRQLMEPMVQTYVILSEMDKHLVAWRNLHLKQATAQSEAASLDQDRADELRDIQLVQDSLATVYVAASEIASTLDFKRGFKENAAAWKNPLQPGEERDRYFAFLKQFKDAASRINSFSKYPDLGKDSKQKIGWQDYSKFAGEAYVRARDVERMLKKDGLRSPKLGKAALSQLKDVLDMSLKMDRMARQLRVEQYLDERRQSSGLAAAAIAVAQRINERRRASKEARAALHKAMGGLGACYLRQCQEKGPVQPAIDTSMTGQPDNKGEPAAALKFYNAKLKAADQRLWKSAHDYAVVADYESRLFTTEKKVNYTKPVVARYKLTNFRRGNEIFRCVPEAAELKVYRRPLGKEQQAVMTLGPVSNAVGEREFRLQQDLTGSWRAENADLEVDVAIRGEAVTLTRKNVPVAGRDRVYSGSLTRQFSEPGDYTILFESSTGQTYLPANFKIEGPLPKVEKPSTLIKIPKDADDIGAGVPRDIREKLVLPPYKDTFRYRATMAPLISADGQLKLEIELYNHKVAFKKVSREIGSVTEKVWHKDQFNR